MESFVSLAQKDTLSGFPNSLGLTRGSGSPTKTKRSLTSTVCCKSFNLIPVEEDDWYHWPWFNLITQTKNLRPLWLCQELVALKSSTVGSNNKFRVKRRGERHQLTLCLFFCGRWYQQWQATTCFKLRCLKLEEYCYEVTYNYTLAWSTLL